MKNYIIILILLVQSGLVMGQTTVTLTGPSDVEDAYLRQFAGDASKANNNYSTSTVFRAQAWTSGGQSDKYRSVLKFDCSGIPTGSIVTNATITFYTDAGWTYNYAYNSSYSHSNEAYLEKITSSWNISTVTWNSQPTTTTEGRVYIPESVSSHETLVVNITDLAQGFVSSPSTNYGVMMKLVNEVAYAGRNYGTTDNTAYAPVISITYQEPSAYGDHNHIVSNSMMTSDGESGEVLTSISYFDGLGRSVQNVAKQHSPGGYDMVQYVTYDSYGRQNKSYLPYTVVPGVISGNSNGSFKTTAATDQNTFYDHHFGDNSGTYAFFETKFEASPLNRIEKTYSPGEAWSSAGDKRPVELEYLANTTTDKAILWEIDQGQLIAYRFYAPGELYKTVTTDEESHQVIEFTDKQGKIVLKKVQAPDSQWADTYYIYDDFDNLRYVLPPGASANYSTSDLDAPAGYYLITEDKTYSEISSVAGSNIAYIPTANLTIDGTVTLPAPFHIKMHGIAPTQDYLDTRAFQYKYDERNRMIEKQVPGAGLVYMVYDKRDRLVLTQDGNQRTANKWTFTKYDQLNRPIITGEKVITGSLTTIQGNVATHNTTNAYETYDGTGITKYTDNSYPTSVTDAEVLTVTYYDNYDFNTLGGFILPAGGAFNSSDYKIIPNDFSSVKGQVTGAKTRILIDGSNSFIETVNFYDDRYRLIQSKVTNHKGGNDVLTTQYDFAGRVRKTYTEHNNPSGDVSSTNITQEYSYDHASRLKTVTHQIGTGPVKTILSNTYNELGELIEKDLADGFEDVDYAYNIRGWLTKINDLSDQTDKFFEMDLKYNDADNIANRSYNGNIGQIDWKNPYESMTNTYDFNYDEMNRLTAAAYDDGGASPMDFDIPAITYDLNGNIQTLQRRGNHNEMANQLYDNLNYDYAGNQLTGVSDASGFDTGFKDGNTSGDDYSYDANGNMVEDKNKGITDIEYNHLNLPRKVEFAPTKYIEYTYDAAGTKLSQKVTDGSDIKTTDYLGGFIYEKQGSGSEQLQFIQHDEGRIVAERNSSGTFTNWEYQYHLKDHLGNVRATFKTETDVNPYPADFETTSASYESTYFTYADDITKINANLFDHTDRPGTSYTYSMRLSGSGYEVNGIAKSLMVKPGDVINAHAWVKYIDGNATAGNTTGDLSAYLDAVANNPSSVIAEAANAVTNTLPYSGMIAYTGEGPVSGVPESYINILIFDQNFQQIGSQFVRVPSGALEDGTNVAHKQVSLVPVTIEKPGYVYIYLSNESAAFEVFFDDFEVEQTNTPIVQKDDYYPFGGTFNSYTSGTENLYKYNNKEEQKELGTYDYGWRQYDPWLGRFNAVDAFADKYFSMTPYQYGANNPIKYVDINGDSLMLFKNGVYVTTVDNGKEEITGYNQLSETDKDGNETFTGGYNFGFNDIDLDKGALESGEMTVELISNDAMESAANGAREAMGDENRYSFIYRESRLQHDGSKGMMDFWATSDIMKGDNVLHVARSKAGGAVGYNGSDFGNFMWGMAGRKLGFNMTTLRLGAHFNNMWNGAEDNSWNPEYEHKLLDAAADQRAIRNGYNYNRKFQENAVVLPRD